MPVTISRLVKQVESGNQIQAMRFEPGWKHDTNILPWIVQAHRPAYMNNTTARTIAATSWGLYQIMGENIYRLGYRLPIMDYMHDEKAQDDMFRKFLIWRGIDYAVEEIMADADKMYKFARRYNGNANEYAARLRTVYAQMGGK